MPFTCYHHGRPCQRLWRPRQIVSCPSEAYGISALNCPALRICSFVISKGQYLDAHLVLFLTRVPFADTSIQFKKATMVSKRLEVVFNGDAVKATLENTDGLTHRWTLERDMCVIF